MSTKKLEFIETLFSAISKDISIPKEIKPYLMALKIAVIKISSDELFFKDVMHPARITLLLLTRICSTHENVRQLSINISKITDKLHHDGDTSLNNFTSVNFALLALMDDSEKTDIIKAYELKAVTSHSRNKHELVKQQVIMTLQKIIADNEIPMIVQELTLKIWPQFLFKRCIDGGRKSACWDEGIEVFEKIIEFIQPVKNVKQWNYLYKKRDSFVESVRFLLNESDINKQRIDVNIDALRSTINININKFKDDNHLLFDGLYSEEEEQQINVDEKSNKANAVELPEYVKIGEWYDVYSGDKYNVNRLKLSLIIEDEGKLIFVDHHGVKGMVKDIDVFTEELSLLLSKPVKSTGTTFSSKFRPKFVDAWNEIKAKLTGSNK